MRLDFVRVLGWRRVLAGVLLGLALGLAACATEKADLQRSDVEQWYKDGKIDRITYDDMMAKINAKEAAAQGNTTATPPAAPIAPPAAPTGSQAPN